MFDLPEVCVECCAETYYNEGAYDIPYIPTVTDRLLEVGSEGDSLYLFLAWSWCEAASKVVLWSSSNWSSSFTISKGASSGIEYGDPVITEYGALVGQVTELGETWATVSTLIDVDMSVGAFVGDTGTSGMVMGEFALMKNKQAKLTFLADGAQIFVGDEVLTSGQGGAFPQGLVIGTITAVQTEAGGQIEFGLVQPQCNFESLVQVFVIKSFEVVE